MNSARDVLVPTINRDEHDKYENGNDNNPRSGDPFNLNFLAVKAATFLAHGLSPDTPEAVALANGAQFILFLRWKGVRADQVKISITEANREL